MSGAKNESSAEGANLERMVMTQALKAREFAAKAHAGQLYGPDQPYTHHLDAVAALVGDNDAVQAVAYLHDVVEDTATTLQEVAAHFGACKECGEETAVWCLPRLRGNHGK